MNHFFEYDGLLYALYAASDFEALKKELLDHLEQLIPHDYSSIMLTAPGNRRGQVVFSEFYCQPSEFMEAEKKFARNYPADFQRSLDQARNFGVIRMSSIQSTTERMNLPEYRECYGPYEIYDALKLAVCYGDELLGLITLFRTRGHGSFEDEDVYLLKALSKHLSNAFYKHRRQSDTSAAVSASVSAIDSRAHMTPKEKEILNMIFLAKTNTEICDQLRIKEHTLQKHFQNIYRKLNISSRWELLRLAVDPNKNQTVLQAI